MQTKKPDAGTILVQLLIACLILAMTASGIMGVLLGTYGQSGGRLMRKEQGTLAANQVLEALKNYVTADPSSVTQAFAPNSCWNFLDPVAGCLPGWALSPGAHDVSFLLPAALQPFQVSCPGSTGSLIYTVTSSGSEAPANISVQVCWQEPRS